MSLHLITGYAGQEHITAADHASFNMGVFGKGAFLFDRGNKFKAEIISNNLIRILDGDMMFQGRHVRLAENTYEELMIDNGTQGMKRFDLIVARYTKDVTTGVEKCEFAVLKGEENASTAVEPTRADGDISEDGNALITEVPIYRVELDGLNISKLQKKIYVKKLLENPIVPKTKSMRISKTGWYRIAKIECDSLSDARGGIGNNCNIEISRSFNALSTEFKKIQLVSINNSTKFTDETSSAVTNGQLIAKIRHTLDTATNTGYVEIYYSNDSTNNMLVTISNHMNYNGQYWELITPELTAETVDGVTVLGSHDFSLNGRLDIMDKITLGSMGAWISYAFVKDGIAHIKINMKKGLTGNTVGVFTVDDERYKPLVDVKGLVTYTHSSDNNKVINFAISPTGQSDIWVSSAMSYECYGEVHYPIK